MFSTSIFAPSPCPSTVHIFLFFFVDFSLAFCIYFFLSPLSIALSPRHVSRIQSPSNIPLRISPSVFSISPSCIHPSNRIHLHLLLFSFFYFFFVQRAISFIFNPYLVFLHFFFPSSPSSLFHFPPHFHFFLYPRTSQERQVSPTEWNMLGCSLRLAAV